MSALSLAACDASGSLQEDLSGSSSVSCFTIETDVTMIREAFSAGQYTPHQVSLLLDTASQDWANEALKTSGSESDWLFKMSELSTKLSSYITTGTPANGELIMSQLEANMALVDQFCG